MFSLPALIRPEKMSGHVKNLNKYINNDTHVQSLSRARCIALHSLHIKADGNSCITNNKEDLDSDVETLAPLSPQHVASQSEHEAGVNIGLSV